MLSRRSGGVVALAGCVLLAACHARQDGSVRTSVPESAAGYPIEVQLTNPTLTEGTVGWEFEGDAAAFESAAVDGRQMVRARVDVAQPPGWVLMAQRLQFEPGQHVYAEVRARAVDVHDGWGALIAISHHDAAGAQIAQVRSEITNREQRWETLTTQTIVPEGTAWSRFKLTLHGAGVAYFDTPQVRVLGDEPPPIEGPVILTVTPEVVCEKLVGFGAEDDGWFYNDVNRRHGVEPADYAVRERRIRWLDPDWVRMFMWYPDWCPSGDWETFTWDTPNMQSKYRTLDVYQEIGAAVNVVGVSWGMERPYDRPEAFAQAVGSLFEHLIRTRGYTCVRYWTLANEPDSELYIHYGYSFDEYRRLHERVQAEFARRGLDVQIVGSDDAMSARWFNRCVADQQYADLADVFATHCYFHAGEYGLVDPFFEARTPALRKHAPGKPMVVAEYGFLSPEWHSHFNPLMRTYDYALLTTEFCIAALNHGAAGTCIWVLESCYYIDDKQMTFGLWEFADQDYQPRPVYHAAGMFSRLTEAGDAVRKVTSTHPRQVVGGCAGGTLFWVNLTDQSAEVRVTGLPVTAVRVMTESTLHGDQACGVVQDVDDGRFLAPPRSFGHSVIE